MSDGERDGTNFETNLSNLRHDLRTPVGHIIGYAELIDDDLDEDLRATYGQELAAIEAAGQKILALIDQHLGGSRRSLEEIDLTEAQFGLRLNLNHIGGYAEILREEAVDRGHESVSADLDRILRANQQVLQLLEEMAARLLAGPETGPAPDQPSPHVAGGSAVTMATVVGIGGEILVVDDDEENRDLLTRRLARGGYVSVAVDSGAAALELMGRRRFDLVLLDYMMEGLSGLETLQAIKSDPRLRAIPVIMLSAADASELMVNCILGGAEDYVAKPFNPVLLIARINACLEKIRLRQNAARQIKVFISSPGDVIPERQIVKMVLGRLNEEFAGRALLVPVMWEDEPLLASDTFQAQIHPPRESDIYLGIVWSRIGSPLPPSIRRPDGTVYESGSVFEFEDALAGYRAAGKPEMLLYRKSGTPEISLAKKDVVLERLDQLDSLKAYLDKVLLAEDGSFSAAFHVFDTAEQFEILAETHLRKLVQRIVSDQHLT